MKKMLFSCAGVFFFAMALAGAVIPVLPTFPFLLLAGFCFAKGSDTLNEKFKSTKFYSENLKTYTEGRGMSLKSKVKILVYLSLIMAFGFYKMRSYPFARAILLFIWAAHFYYFIFRVENYREPSKRSDETESFIENLQ